MRPIIIRDKFYWNLSQSVGKNASNGDPADISFVQWMLGRLGYASDPSATAIYDAVRITGICSGRDDDPLVIAIRDQQMRLQLKNLSLQVDGHVSVAQGHFDGGMSYAPHTAFLVFFMCYDLAHEYRDKYPRLDLIPGCPPSVAAATLKAIPC